MPSKARAILGQIWREWAKPILVVVTVLSTFRSAVADWNDVPTGSMKPTILEGDRIFINKLAYDLRMPFVGWRLAELGEPGRGDVIIFPSPADGIRLVKRVVGLPGDEIALADDQLILNGKPVAYLPLDAAIVGQVQAEERAAGQFAAEAIAGQTHPVMFTPARAGWRYFGPVVVPPGHYFVMGDNRDNSRDSRSFGFVPRDSIQGRATTVVLSLDPAKSYAPRWERFFRGLD